MSDPSIRIYGFVPSGEMDLPVLDTYDGRKSFMKKNLGVRLVA